jgi:hypothetical protein
MNCPVCGTNISSEMTQCTACGYTLPVNTPLAPENEAFTAESASSVAASLSEAGEHQETSGGSPPPPFAPLEPPRQKSRPRRSGWFLVLGVVLLLLVGGSGLTYYLAVYQPNQRIMQATATAQAQQLHRRSTATAQANATAQAQAAVAATAQAQAQATAQALQNIYVQATAGAPSLTDSLAQNGPHQWVEDSTNDGGCTFANGGFRVAGDSLCPARATTYQDLAYQAQMTFVSDSGMGGLLFRADQTGKSFYFFAVEPDGNYVMFSGSVQPNRSLLMKVLKTGSSQQIHTGLNQTNLLSVVARGQNLYFYVNQHYIDSVEDGTATSGMIGVGSLKFGGTPDVVFTHAQVWAL